MPSDNELTLLIEGGENDRAEFTGAANDPDKLREAICAFADDLPSIAEAMKSQGFMEHFGMGIPTARRALKENGNPPPDFRYRGNTQDASSETTRPAARATTTGISWRI